MRHRIGRMHMIYDRVNRLTWVADRHVQNHLCPVMRNMSLVWGRQIRLFIIIHAQLITLGGRNVNLNVCVAIAIGVRPRASLSRHHVRVRSGQT